VRLDAVEIKVNVAREHIHKAIDELQFKDRNTFQIWFYEDTTPGVPPIPLNAAGVILRVRVKDNGKVDSTVKLRPCRRSELTEFWLSTKSEDSFEFTIEEDRVGTRRSLAVSSRVDRKTDTFSSATAPYSLAELISKRQLDFLDSCGTLRVNVAELTPLGPIKATRWMEVGGSEYKDLRARAERWRVRNEDFLELSVRASLEEAGSKNRRLGELVASRGVTVDGSTENKTRRVLDALSN
jgi:hypothetical protein